MTDVDDPELERWRHAHAAAPRLAPHPDAERWRAFFEGTLSDADQDATRDHIAACAQCAGIFKSARAAALAAAPPIRVAPVRERPRQWITVAATLSIAGLAIVVLWPLPEADQALAPAPPPAIATGPAPAPAPAITFDKPAVVVSAEQLLVSRGDAAHTAYLEALARALDPYQKDDFAEATRRLEPLAAAHPDRFEPSYYLGVSLLMSGRAADAVPILERAMQIAPEARRADAQRALAAARGPR